MDRSLPAKGAQRWVPFTYLALAHLALGSACAVTLWDSSLIAGFFYHPKMIAVVHSLTLGWISCSLIGMLYVAGDRLGFRATRPDVAILVAWAAGASGLVSHFWIETFGGMMWSAGLLGVAVLAAAVRFGMAFAAASLPDGVKLQINFACLNLVGTAFIGLLLGINKTSTVLPGYSLHNVFAHAHLAALGWAFLLAVALGHLFLVTHGGSMPAARWSMSGTVLTQLGAAGIFVSLLIDEPYVLVFGIVVLSGMTLCVVGLIVHARSVRPPTSRAALLLLVGALVWLLIAAGIGFSVLTGLRADGDPGLTMAYGVAGLLGGLGQWTCGLSLLWFRRPRLRPGHTWPAVVGWFVASPLLVAGLAGTYPVLIAVGAASLLLATVWTARSILSAARRSTR
jgi:hypothetical protein